MVTRSVDSLTNERNEFMSFKLIAALALFSFSTPAFAQFGGGGFGGGDGGFFGDFEFETAYGTYIESGGVFAAISISGKTVTAFSPTTGNTAKLNFEKKIEPYVPMVARDMVCFMHDKTAYAFSAQTGKWDSVKTKKGTWIPVVSGNILCFVDGNTAYAFGAKHGKWIQVDTEKAPVPTVSGSMVKIRVGSKIYICSSTSTEWQVIDLESDE